VCDLACADVKAHSPKRDARHGVGCAQHFGVGDERFFMGVPM
jgi:hypothetical protein